jgi:hypothetical protein
MAHWGGRKSAWKLEPFTLHKQDVTRRKLRGQAKKRLRVNVSNFTWQQREHAACPNPPSPTWPDSANCRGPFENVRLSTYKAAVSGLESIGEQSFSFG